MFVALVKPSDSPVSVLGRMSMPTFVTAASKRWIGGHSFVVRRPTSVDCTDKHSHLDPFFFMWILDDLVGYDCYDWLPSQWRFWSVLSVLQRCPFSPAVQASWKQYLHFAINDDEAKVWLRGKLLKDRWRMVIRKVIPHHSPGDSICLTDDSSPRMFPNCFQRTSKNKALNLEFQSLISRLWTAIH